MPSARACSRTLRSNSAPASGSISACGPRSVGVEAEEEGTHDLVERMSNGPIAELPARANEQHYEMPPESRVELGGGGSQRRDEPAHGARGSAGHGAARRPRRLGRALAPGGWPSDSRAHRRALRTPGDALARPAAPVTAISTPVGLARGYRADVSPATGLTAAEIWAGAAGTNGWSLSYLLEPRRGGRGKNPLVRSMYSA